MMMMMAIQLVSTDKWKTETLRWESDISLEEKEMSTG